MIANRQTMIVKQGCWDEVVASVVAETCRVSFPHPRRIFTANIGPFDRLVFEAEFENLAEYEKFWAEYLASPEGAAFTEKLNSMLESGGSNEIWTLEECIW
jgi:hypothetical protein